MEASQDVQGSLSRLHGDIHDALDTAPVHDLQYGSGRHRIKVVVGIDRIDNGAFRKVRGARKHRTGRKIAQPKFDFRPGRDHRYEFVVLVV